jgi:hypothetical protein
MTEIPKSMTPEETAKLREAWIRDGFVPTVASVFAKYPTLRSATMLVAQYWSDEAEDAVHYALVYSVLDTPDLDAARAAEHDADPVNHPPGFEAWDLPYVEVWDDNDESISLFAAFCTEGADQEMPWLEAYTPYAIFRRDGDAVRVEVVGTMIRPWLDGVTPTELLD